jgi:hypothetical protein
MNMKTKNIRETVKNTALGVLILLMLYLVLRLWLSAIPAASGLSLPDGAVSFLERIDILPQSPAEPAVFGSTFDRESGLFSSEIAFKQGNVIKVAYAGGGQLETARQLAGDLFSDALASSSYEERELSLTEAYRIIRQQDGIMVTLREPLTAGTLAALKGIELRFSGAASLFTSRMFLSAQNRTVYLYLLDEGKGKAAAVRTAVSTSTLSNILGMGSGLDAFASATFSSASTDLVNADPLSVMLYYREPVRTPVLQVCNPLFSRNQESFATHTVHNLLASLFYNPYNTKMYQEGDGSLVYVENSGTVTFTPDGFVFYKAAEPAGIPLSKLTSGSMSVYSMVRASAALLARMDPAVLGGSAATVGFNSISYFPEKERYRLRFDYLSDSVPIRMSAQPGEENEDAGLPAAGQSAAVFDFSLDGRLVYGEFFMRQFEWQGDYLENMPQALAQKILQTVVDASESAGDLRLVYMVDGSGIACTRWIAVVCADRKES